jgi:hypothetical protein
VQLKPGQQRGQEVVGAAQAWSVHLMLPARQHVAAQLRLPIAKYSTDAAIH